MHASREHQGVREEFDTCNDGSLQQPSNAPITERDRDERQLQTRISPLEEKLMELQRQFDDLKMECGLKFDALTRRVESIERGRALQNIAGAYSREYPQAQQASNYDGELLWKITEYARKRSEAVNGQKVSFDSPCFYTSRYGYKMCARIYLNGDGMGRGTHISLFFVVMRGEYDAILRWPFRQKVTFILLDQDNVEHVIDGFRPDPNSSSFQRPQRETNIRSQSSGCPTFFSIEELNNHAYVREDTMFFKIIVDTSGLQ